MKRYIYCALIALLTLSCSKDDEPSMDKPFVAPRALYAQTPFLESRAVKEFQPVNWDESETVDSRTYAVVDPENASEYYQYWSEGNEISLFFTTQNLRYRLNSFKEDSLDVGYFELVGDDITGTTLKTNYYYSVYPYKDETKINPNGNITYNFPETQHYNIDSYANGENGMIAFEAKQEWDELLYFQNFCSYLQLRLVTDTNVPKTVKKITLSTNNSNDYITGDSRITISNNVPTVTMTKNTGNNITLECESGVELSIDENNPTKFWFVLPGGFTFTEGFNVTIIFDDNTYFKQSTQKNIGIARNHIKPMATLQPESIRPTGPIRYKYHDTNITEPFPLKNTFFDADGKSLDIVNQIYDEENDEWIVLLSGELKTIGSNSFETPTNASGEFVSSYPDIEYIKVDCDNKISLADFAFYNCTAETLMINSNIESIGAKVVNASNINTITFAEDKVIDVIKKDAFLSFGNLTSINLNNVKEIQDNAFFECTGLTTVSLNSVEKIGISAFQNCTSLQGPLTLPETLLEIGEGAFNTTLIRTVYCYATTPPYCNHDNQGNAYIFHEDTEIYVPSGTEWDYDESQGWFLYELIPM